MTTLESTLPAYPALSSAAVLLQRGQPEQAAARVMEHLRRHPDEPRGLALLGDIAVAMGALGQAEHFLRSAIARGHREFEVRRNLASVLNQQERPGEAAPLFASLEQESDDQALPAMRALILNKIGHYDEALALQERLALANPNRPPHWIAYGHTLRAAGRIPEAVHAYRTAIAADPECGEAWWGVGNIKSRVLEDADIAAMRRAIDTALDVRNTAPLHFALARGLHDRGDHAGAFRHYSIGNAQRADSIGYDPRELTAEVAEIERAVDSDFISSLYRERVGDTTPVFIISLPRSGSTLLEQMLGSHPDIEPVGELPYIPAILRSVMEMATRRGRVTVPQLIAGLSADHATALGQDYLRRAALHRKTGRPYFLDKLPHNWSNVLFIRRILPEARFIDIRRSAMDCCFSNFTQSFSSAHASSFSLDHIGQCYVDYVRLMAHFDQVAAGMIHHVDYERMIGAPEPEIRAVLDYLDLPWDPRVLEFHKLDRVVRTPSSEQVRRPLNRDGMKAWVPYAEWLGPLRDTLGPLAE